MAEYELRLSDQFGQRLPVKLEPLRFRWVRRVNGTGAFEAVFSQDNFPRSWWRLDRRLEVWRQAEGSKPELVGIYLLRYRKRETTGGHKIVTVKGPDVVDLLERRIVAYPAASAQAAKSGAADDLMKAYVRENLGSLATNAARDLSALDVQVQPNLGLGPTISTSHPWEHLLDALLEIHDLSLEEGTPVYFDLVPLSPRRVEFRTYIGRRGTDRRKGMLFSMENRNMANPQLIEDYRDEVNYIYAAGQGEEDMRTVVELLDGTRITASAFNRREALADGRNYETTANLTAYGKAKLREGRPVIEFRAELVQTEGSQFGVDYNLGDQVLAEYEEELFECAVAVVDVQVEGGRETISAKIEYVD